MTYAGPESVGGIEEVAIDAQPVLIEDAPNEEIVGHFDNWERDQFPADTDTLPSQVTAENVDELLSGGANIAPEMVEAIKSGTISLSL